MDARKIRRRLTGVFFIIIPPVIIVAGCIIFWTLSLPFAIVTLIVLGIAYLAALSNRVAYGSQQLRLVEIPNAPDVAKEWIKTTTSQGDPIYVYLLGAFEERRNLSQSALADNIQRKHQVTLRLQSIRPYILDLEKERLIHSPTTSRDKEYNLTPKGRWWLQTIKICFPRTIFWFLVRHYLGIRKLQEFPEDEEKKLDEF